MILFNDTETGGFEHGVDALLQLASVMTDDALEREISSFQSYVYPPPGLHISDSALEATGLDLEHCLNAPTEEQVLKMWIEWVLFHCAEDDELPLFGGYNCFFDLQVIDAALARHNLMTPYRVHPKRGGFDVMKLFLKQHPKKTLPKRLNEKTGTYHTHRLVDACAMYRISLLNAHDAVADCRATKEVAKHVRHLWT